MGDRLIFAHQNDRHHQGVLISTQTLREFIYAPSVWYGCCDSDCWNDARYLALRCVLLPQRSLGVCFARNTYSTSCAYRTVVPLENDLNAIVCAMFGCLSRCVSVCLSVTEYGCLAAYTNINKARHRAPFASRFAIYGVLTICVWFSVFGSYIVLWELLDEWFWLERAGLRVISASQVRQNKHHDTIQNIIVHTQTQSHRKDSTIYTSKCDSFLFPDRAGSVWIVYAMRCDRVLYER